jgi:hypothetical protein
VDARARTMWSPTCRNTGLSRRSARHSNPVNPPLSSSPPRPPCSESNDAEREGLIRSVKTVKGVPRNFIALRFSHTRNSSRSMNSLSGRHHLADEDAMLPARSAPRHVGTVTFGEDERACGRRILPSGSPVSWCLIADLIGRIPYLRDGTPQTLDCVPLGPRYLGPRYRPAFLTLTGCGDPEGVSPRS